MHCMRFWMKILTSEVYEGRLLRKVAREAVKCGKGVWIKNMAEWLRDFELQDMGVERLRRC